MLADVAATSFIILPPCGMALLVFRGIYTLLLLVFGSFFCTWSPVFLIFDIIPQWQAQLLLE